MKKLVVLILACSVTIWSTNVSAQTRRRSPARRSASASKATTEKPAPEIKAGRERVAAQAKVLTHFLYLYGGVVKGIESVDLAARNNEASSTAIDQNERNKTKVKESIRNLRAGFDKLGSDFLANPALKNYYPSIAGVARTVEAAENQAAANRFDEAGKTLLRAADQLADTLAAIR